jgi:hypothetical protein
MKIIPTAGKNYRSKSENKSCSKSQLFVTSSNREKKQGGALLIEGIE